MDFLKTYTVNTVYEEFNGKERKEKLRHGEHQSVCSCFILSIHGKRGKCCRATGRRGKCSHVPSAQQQCEHKHLYLPDLKTHERRFSPTSEVEAETTPKAPVFPSNRQVTDTQGRSSEGLLAEPGPVSKDAPCCVSDLAPILAGSDLGPVMALSEGLILSPGT